MGIRLRFNRHGLCVVLCAAVLAVLLIPANIAMARTVLADSCAPPPGFQGNGGWGLFGSASGLDYSRSEAAQGFTAVTGRLDSAAFWVTKFYYPTGKAYALVYDLTGDFGTNSVPTGAPLATSDPVNVARLSSDSMVTFHFKGRQKIALQGGKRYAIAIRYEGVWVWGGNLLAVDLNPDPAAHPGNPSLYYSDSGWFPAPQYDLYFSVYEKPHKP